MNINGNIVKKLAEIQLKESQKSNSEFYDFNKFMLFAMAISTKKTTVINSLIQEQNFSEREIEEYLSKLNKEELLSKDDSKLIKRINGKYKSKNYEQEIDEIVNHFNRVANKRMRVSKTVTEKLTSLLKTEKYEVRDFKKVSLYFTKLWSVDPKMAQYVNMDTFFRLTKFEEKLNKANDFFDELNFYKKETKKICQEFKSMINMEFIQRNKLISSNYCATENVSCENMPLQLQTIIIHWLKQNYSTEDIILTITGTIEQWSKKPELAQYISINKILDEKFPQRALAVKRLLDKGKILKSGVLSVENWIHQDKETSDLDSWLQKGK